MKTIALLVMLAVGLMLGVRGTEAGRDTEASFSLSYNVLFDTTYYPANSLCQVDEYGGRRMEFSLYDTSPMPSVFGCIVNCLGAADPIDCFENGSMIMEVDNNEDELTWVNWTGMRNFEGYQVRPAIQAHYASGTLNNKSAPLSVNGLNNDLWLIGSPCRDANEDGFVTALDWMQIIGDHGQEKAGSGPWVEPSDVDRDGSVGGLDFFLALGQFGLDCSAIGP